jgi:hypothetical protein
MLQADVPLLTTHAAYIDSLHLMNSGNSGSAEIGNVAVEAEVDIEAGKAVAVVIEAMIAAKTSQRTRYLQNMLR